MNLFNKLFISMIATLIFGTFGIVTFLAIAVNPAYASHSVPFQEKAWGNLKDTIQVASIKTGVSPVTLSTLLSIETTMGTRLTNRKNPSVGGLFHFTDGTWNETLALYGKKYGLRKGTPKSNKKAAALMVGERVKHNKAILEKSLKREVTLSEVYMAHLLGVYGAKKILSADSKRLAKDVTRVSGNRSFFYKNGRALTVKEFKENLKGYVERHASTYRSEAIALVAPVTTGYQLASR